MGDSLVRHAGENNPQPLGEGVISWLGYPGRSLAEMPDKLCKHLRKNPHPSVLIIHAGTCDVFEQSTKEMRWIIGEVLWGIRNLLPSTTIIWSDILPRTYYHGELTPGAGRRIINFFNAQAHGQIHKIENAGYIYHKPLFPPKHYNLYRRDGLHLAKEGNIVFRMYLAEAVLYFRTHPGAKVFPPTS